MAELSITKSYSDGTVLNEADLDEFKTAVETLLNTTGLEAENIKAQGVSGSKFQVAAVTTVKIRDAAITRSKIGDSQVTRGKLEADNTENSSSSGSFSDSGSSEVDITNLSQSITTQGRPILISLKADPGQTLTTVLNQDVIIRLYRDATVIDTFTSPGSSSISNYVLSAPVWVDRPSAGTYTYKLTVNPAGSSFVANNYVLTLTEIYI